jgi:hypothetical protein
VQSLVETSRQTSSYGTQQAACGRVSPGGMRRGPARVVDSESYQALLANLGLEPDPRLCVPAVQR